MDVPGPYPKRWNARTVHALVPDLDLSRTSECFNRDLALIRSDGMLVLSMLLFPILSFLGHLALIRSDGMLVLSMLLFPILSFLGHLKDISAIYVYQISSGH